jgi:hypothetical protein
LSVHKRNVVYFETPGFVNTSSVVDAIRERINLGDVESVVVPVTTGRTAETFDSQLKDKIGIITISEEEVMLAFKNLTIPAQSSVEESESARRHLEDLPEELPDWLRRDTIDMSLLPFSGKTYGAVREILYAFGQGMKVAVEVSLAAVELGKVKPHIKIIAVGGTGEGADTAIVARTAVRNEAFGRDYEKRLSVQEILAMPIEKL